MVVAILAVIGGAALLIVIVIGAVLWIGHSLKPGDVP